MNRRMNTEITQNENPVAAAAGFSLWYPDEYKSESGSKSEPSEAGPIWERKKDAADMQFSRLLRKPRKRNAAESF